MIYYVSVLSIHRCIIYTNREQESEIPNTSLNKSWAWHIDGATNKKIHIIFIKY